METPVFMAFMSKVNGDQFANISSYAPPDGMRHQKSTYFFMKIDVLQPHNNDMLTPIYDTTLQFLTSSQQLRKRFEQDENSLLQPRGSAPCQRISNKHASIKEAKVLQQKVWMKSVQDELNNSDADETKSISTPIQK